MASKLNTVGAIVEFTVVAMGTVKIDRAKLEGAIRAHLGRSQGEATVKASFKEASKGRMPKPAGVDVRYTVKTVRCDNPVSRLCHWAEVARLAYVSGDFEIPSMSDDLVDWLAEKFEVKPEAPKIPEAPKAEA